MVFHQQEENEDFIGAADLSSTELDFDILDKLEKLDFNATNNRSTTSSSSSSNANEVVASTSAACKQKLGPFDIPFDVTEDEIRYSQQETDEVNYC